MKLLSWLAVSMGAAAESFWRGRVRCCVSGRTKRPGHIVLLAQNARRHVCSTGAHRRELEAPAGILLERNSSGRCRFDGACYLIHRLGVMPVGHADDRLSGLLHPGQDLLVLDLEFGVALCLSADLLAVGVVLT